MSLQIIFERDAFLQNSDLAVAHPPGDYAHTQGETALSPGPDRRAILRLLRR
jgi:hypothetical protein